MYGHVEKLAQEIKKGAESIEGVEVKLWQVCKSIIRTYKVCIILFKKICCNFK
jgi:multimeric flavodoxin WrbA